MPRCRIIFRVTLSGEFNNGLIQRKAAAADTHWKACSIRGLRVR